MHQSALNVLIPLAVVGLIVWRRSRSLARPLRGNGWGLLLPPLLLLLFLPTAFLRPDGHFALPAPPWALLLALLAGLLFAAPLVWFTRYERREDGAIYHQQGNALLIALLALIVVRLGLRFVLTGLDPVALNALFFLAAIAYLVTWRVASFMKYRRVFRAR